LNGYFPGDDGMRLSSQMLECKTVNIDGEEVIDGVVCKIVSATGLLGKMREWIAPSRSYVPLKVTYDKGLNDISYSGKPISEQPKGSQYPGQSLLGYSCVLDNVKLLKIGEVDVPVAGRVTETEHFSKNHDTSTVFTYNYTDVELNPNFEGTDYFTPKLVKNAPVVDIDNNILEVPKKWDGKKAVATEPGVSWSSWDIVRLVSLMISVLALLGLFVVFYQRRARRL
jgi:hypothetical protein